MKKTPPRAGEKPLANVAKLRRNRARRTATVEQVLLTVPQAAVLLGWTERATWQAIYRRKLPARRLGTRVFCLREELDQFLKGLPGVSVEEALESLANAV
jgi:excisionase family DNA binding protein